MSDDGRLLFKIVRGVQVVLAAFAVLGALCGIGAFVAFVALVVMWLFS